MAEIIAYGSKHSHEFKLTVNETSTSVTNNTSTISFSFTLYKSSYSWSGYNNITFSVNINGQTYSGTIPSYSAGSTLTLASGNQTINHNSDGTKSIDFSFNVTDNSGVSYACGNASASGSMALTTIPRASTINSVSGTDIDGNFVVNYTSYYSGFTNKLRISIPNVVALQTHSYSSGTSFKLDNSTISYLYSYMSNKKYVNLGFVIETYNGSTKIGESAEIVQRCYITNCEPTIESEAYLDTNTTVTAITGNNQKIVRNASTLQINLTNLASYKNATLSSCKVTIGNVTKSFTDISGTSISSATLNFGTLDIAPGEDPQSPGTVPATIVLTDSRGYKVTKTLAVFIIDYIMLSINAVVKRTQPTTGQVDVSFTGNYFNDDIGNTANTLAMKWYYRESGTDNWTQGGTITPTITNNTYSNGENPIIISNIFDYEKSYEIKLEVKDAITTLEPVYTIMEGIPIFNWGKNFFNINGDLSINGELSINGMPINSYSENEITVGYWIDGKPLYRKVVDTGSISGSSKDIAHNISNLDTVVKLSGIAYASSLGTRVTLPRVYTSSLDDQIGLECNNTNIHLSVGSSASFTSSFVIIEYTKTTDTI